MSDPSIRNPADREPPPPAAHCLNCGNTRPSRFCAQCGQNDRNYVRGLATVGWEFCREAFEVDSRLLQTLKLLLLKPGSLTSEFSRNRRARYMSPIRLYLFTSFLFVLVLSFAMPDSFEEGLVGTGADPEESSPEGEVVPGANLQVSGPTTLSDAELRAMKAALGPAQSRKLDDILGRPDDHVSKRAVIALAGLVSPAAQTPAVRTESDSVGPGSLEVLMRPDSAGSAPQEDADSEDSLPTAPEEPASPEQPDAPDEPGRPNLLVRMFLGSMIDLLHDPEVFVQRVIGNLPIAMFFLLPFLALALSVCYARKKRFFVEHLVFGMHNQTFSFLCLAAALLTSAGPIGRWFLLFFTVVPQLYYLIALRCFYRDGWIRTLIKGSIVWWLYLMFLLPGFFLVLFLTA